jgi:hypothetical protein
MAGAGSQPWKRKMLLNRPPVIGAATQVRQTQHIAIQGGWWGRWVSRSLQSNIASISNVGFSRFARATKKAWSRQLEHYCLLLLCSAAAAAIPTPLLAQFSQPQFRSCNGPFPSQCKELNLVSSDLPALTDYSSGASCSCNMPD